MNTNETIMLFPLPPEAVGAQLFPGEAPWGTEVGYARIPRSDGIFSTEEIRTLGDRGAGFRGFRLSTWRGGYEWIAVPRYSVYIEFGGVSHYDTANPEEVGWVLDANGWRYHPRTAAAK